MKNVVDWIRNESKKLGYDFNSLNRKKQDTIILLITTLIEDSFRSKCNYPDLCFARIMNNRSERNIVEKDNKIENFSNDNQCFYGGGCLNVCDIGSSCTDNSGCLHQSGACIDDELCTNSISCFNSTNCIDNSGPISGCNDLSCNNNGNCWDRGGECLDDGCTNGSKSSNDNICINDYGCKDTNCLDYRCFNNATEGMQCSTDSICKDIKCMDVGERQAEYDADPNSCPYMSDHSASSCIDHVCDPPEGG